MSAEPIRDALGRRRPNRNEHYTDAQKAEGVGLAAAIGDKAAAAQLGIPRRNLSRWRREPSPAVQAAIGRTRDDVAARLWEAVTAGTDAVLTGLRDPKARLSDKASALRIVVEAHALITGGATARTENVNVTEERARETADLETHAAFLRAIVDATEEERRQYLAEHGIEVFRQIARDRQIAGDADVG